MKPRAAVKAHFSPYSYTCDSQRCGLGWQAKISTHGGQCFFSSSWGPSDGNAHRCWDVNKYTQMYGV